MQDSIIFVNLILSVIGFMCICLKTYDKDKHISRTARTVVIVGAAVGVGSSVLAVTP